MCLVRAASVAFCFLLVGACCRAQAGPTASSPAALQRQKAISFEQQGNFPAAEEAWRALLKGQPRNAEAYAQLGFLAARKENYREAIPLYRKALALGLDFPGLRMNLGLALFKDRQPKESIPQFTHVLNSPTTLPADAFRARLLIGMAHYAQGEYADAVPFLKEAASADPKSLPIRLVLAHSCLWAKQNQCVLDTYKEILTINPDSAEAYVLAGEAMDAMNNPTGAIEQFRLAIQANPHEPHAHFGLGYLLWTQKAYDQAAGEFQAELDQEPDHAQSLLYLADIDVKANRFAEARPLLERAEKADPSESLAHLDMGIVLSDAGQLDEAIRELKEASRLDPNDSDPHWRLGQIYRGRGDLEAANEEFAKTRQLKQVEHKELFQKLANGRPPVPETEPSLPQSADRQPHQ